jgi:2-iminobutanoate/2-iminopropanoate deaminase
MALKIERFQPEGMNVRMSGGHPSYSHVVTVSGTGKIVYVAGQLARDIDGNCVGKGDMRAQMEQTFKNLDRCLKAAGATWADVVKTNTLVTDFDEFQKCGDVRMRYFGVATPTLKSLSHFRDGFIDRDTVRGRVWIFRVADVSRVNLDLERTCYGQRERFRGRSSVDDLGLVIDKLKMSNAELQRCTNPDFSQWG